MGEETTARPAGSVGHDEGWPSELTNLYRDQRTSFVRLAYLLTGRRAVAEEIVQDAFIGVHRCWDRVRDPKGYLRAGW